MSELLTFDDVLIQPKFSRVNSRKDVDLSSMGLTLPVFSANMDTVTGAKMAETMFDSHGGMGVLHRFWSIEDNVKEFNSTLAEMAVSVGIGKNEMDRAVALKEAGATLFFIDVAHGAQLQVVDFYNTLQKELPKINVVVGNFATGKSIDTFIEGCDKIPYGFKVGVGPSGVCSTRVKTGCGIPQLSAIFDCDGSKYRDKFNLIADGGMRTPGDIAKALSKADAVMTGGMLAGTEETPGEVITDGEYNWPDLNEYKYKIYRGSASKESYQDQNKESSWRTAEGETLKVPYKGSVTEVLSDIEGGLRSAFTYVGAENIKEFKEKAELLRISKNSVRESGIYG